jgi:hypothetical protein
MNDKRPARYPGPHEAIDGIVGEIVAANGIDHMGAAWLHAHDRITGRAAPDMGVSPKIRTRTVEDYDPEELDGVVEEDAVHAYDVNLEHASGWTPFHDAQIAQCRRLVSRSLSKLSARLEFVLRHIHGVGMPPRGWETNADGEDGRAFSMRTVAERFGMTRGIIDVNAAKAARICSFGQDRSPNHPGAMMRAALDQFGDVDVAYLCSYGEATFRCSIRHDHATAIAQREDRLAERIMTTFPELAQMRESMPETTPRRQMQLICRDWKEESDWAQQDAVSMARQEGRPRWSPSRLQMAWTTRRNDERAVRNEIAIVTRGSGLTIEIVPAPHAGQKRMYRILATYRGRTNDEMGVMIPSGTPLPAELKWARHVPTEMLLDVQRSLADFAVIVLSRERDQRGRGPCGGTPVRLAEEDAEESSRTIHQAHGLAA